MTLDNIKAMVSRDRGERDLTSSQCVFAQAYRQLCDTDPKVLRTVWDGERVFQVRSPTSYGEHQVFVMLYSAAFVYCF